MTHSAGIPAQYTGTRCGQAKSVMESVGQVKSANDGNLSGHVGMAGLAGGLYSENDGSEEVSTAAY